MIATLFHVLLVEKSLLSAEYIMYVLCRDLPYVDASLLSLPSFALGQSSGAPHFRQYNYYFMGLTHF